MTETRLTPQGEGRWRLDGVLDFSTVTRLAPEGERLMARASSERALEIDFSGVTAANSAGLALLLEWLDMAQTYRCKLSYAHVPDALVRIARFSNILPLLPLRAADADSSRPEVGSGE